MSGQDYLERLGQCGVSPLDNARLQGQAAEFAPMVGNQRPPLACADVMQDVLGLKGLDVGLQKPTPENLPAPLKFS